MATIDLGKIKQVWRGTYNNGTAYVVDDLVAYTDSGILSTYICVANSTGNAPSSSGTAHASWNYVSKGVADPIPSQSGNSGKYLTSDGSSASWGTIAAGGITMAEQWDLDDEVTVSSGQTYHLTGGFTKRNQTGAGSLGASGMSVSSGIFTFPSTGIYLVQIHGSQRNSFGTGRRRVQSQIWTTHDNSTYAEVAMGGTNLSNRGSTTSCSDLVTVLFDVQNTSNYKATFKINFSNEGRINARDASSSGVSKTCVLFMKLGDT